MINKYTSVYRVFAKLFTDLNLQEENHRLSDWIEWTGEALEKIGATPQYSNKITGKDGIPYVDLVDYRAELPQDLHQIIQVAYCPTEDGPFLTMRYGTGSFEGATSNTYINSDVNHKGIDPKEHRFTNDYVYVINDSYINTNIRDGKLMISYLAVPTDNEGYPMIPDDSSFLEAIYWYITMKIRYPEWAQGSITDRVYFHAENKWNFYCKQAYGKAMMVTVDQWESLKNQWLKLVPSLDDHDTSFSTTGERERMFNPTRRVYGKRY